MPRRARLPPARRPPGRRVRAPPARRARSRRSTPRPGGRRPAAAPIGCRLPHTTRTSPANVTGSASAGRPAAATAAAMLPAVPAKRTSDPHQAEAIASRSASFDASHTANGPPARIQSATAAAPASSITSAAPAAARCSAGRGDDEARRAIVTADRDAVDVDDTVATDPPQPRQRRHEQHPGTCGLLHGDQLVGPVAAQQRVDLVGVVPGGGGRCRDSPIGGLDRESRDGSRCRPRLPFHHAAACARSP